MQHLRPGLFLSRTHPPAAFPGSFVCLPTPPRRRTGIGRVSHEGGEGHRALWEERDLDSRPNSVLPHLTVRHFSARGSDGLPRCPVSCSGWERLQKLSLGDTHLSWAAQENELYPR